MLINIFGINLKLVFQSLDCNKPNSVYVNFDSEDKREYFIIL